MIIRPSHLLAFYGQKTAERQAGRLAGTWVEVVVVLVGVKVKVAYMQMLYGEGGILALIDSLTLSLFISRSPIKPRTRWYHT